MNRLPRWFRQEIPPANTLSTISQLRADNVHTVCIEAHCPNITSCLKNNSITFMILGNRCTRNCAFCAVTKCADFSQLSLDALEPLRIAERIRSLGLRYVVITSVTRDDLEDGGAGHFAQTVELIRQLNAGTKIEVLIPDFGGRLLSIAKVLDAGVEVAAHNLETVSRLYSAVRPLAIYGRSLDVLAKMKALMPSSITKSALLLGLGETEEEVMAAMQDLRSVNCDVLCLGQYLAPSDEHYPAKEFITLEQFEKYRLLGSQMGFKEVLSGPLVRSSYRAEEIFEKVKNV